MGLVPKSESITSAQRWQLLVLVIEAENELCWLIQVLTHLRLLLTNNLPL